MDKKILASVNKRYIGTKCVEFSIALFGNFAISDAVPVLEGVYGIDRVVDHETSYHLELFADIRILKGSDQDQIMQRILKELNSTIYHRLGVTPTYV